MPSFNPIFSPKELQNEVWKPVPGYEEGYEVSDIGRVRSVRKKKCTYIGKMISLQRHAQTGYCHYSLCKNSISKNHLAHRLVAAAFLPRASHQHVVNHIDGDKTNNRAWNLEWCTREENEAHATTNKLKPYGERIWNSKLTDAQVLHIRELLRQGVQGKNIAKMYGVRPSLISAIKLRQIWTHI